MLQISLRVIYSHQDDFLSVSGFTAGGLCIKLLQPGLFYFEDMSEMLRQTGYFTSILLPPVPAHSILSSIIHVHASAHFYAEMSPLQSIYL